MKRRITFLAPVLLILVVLIANTQSSSATMTEHGPSAFGQGGFVFLRDFGTEHWSYSFEAEANKNGQARGRATFDILENLTQTQVVVKINCLDVADSPSGIASATMTGTVLQSNDPEFPKHANVIFGAVDSGTFPVSDIITRMFVFPGGDCHDGAFPLTFFQQPPDAIHIEP